MTPADPRYYRAGDRVRIQYVDLGDEKDGTTPRARTIEGTVPNLQERFDDVWLLREDKPSLRVHRFRPEIVISVDLVS